MPYVIINEENSNNIPGLLIQSLAPITKPPQRTNVIQIDGRDGDIIETLDYSAYDKGITIGLFGNYDINRIIKYFTGKGKIVFSNEPDKIYYFEIYDKIDYEKLVKFKIAKIKLHIQPYKYLLNEPLIDLVIDSQTEIIVNNKGLEIAKPIITLYGTGIITLSINNFAVFQVDMMDEYIVIDSSIEEAYKDNVLKNRCMTGMFPILEVGDNVITWVGNLTRIVIEPRSRWL